MFRCTCYFLIGFTHKSTMKFGSIIFKEHFSQSCTINAINTINTINITINYDLSVFYGSERQNTIIIFNAFHFIIRQIDKFYFFNFIFMFNVYRQYTIDNITTYNFPSIITNYPSHINFYTIAGFNAYIKHQFTIRTDIIRINISIRCGYDHLFRCSSDFLFHAIDSYVHLDPVRFNFKFFYVICVIYAYTIYTIHIP